MKYASKYISLLIISLLYSIVGCHKVNDSKQRPNLDGRKARVVATTGMIADAVREIAGNEVEIISLIGPGGDPHKYYATAGDIDKLKNADLILYNGLHLEAAMTRLFENMSHQVRTVAISHNIEVSRLRHADEGSGGEYDPHIWFDVSLWCFAVENISQALCELDPKNRELYTKETCNYLNRLKKLHHEIQEMSQTIPKEKRVIITAHDAFGYFGQAYGFEVRGLQGTSTASQTGTKAVQELVHLIGSRRIPVIFAETSVPDEGMKAVLEAVRIQYPDVQLRLSPHRLFSDALGPAETAEGSYIGMVRYNIRTIVGALRP